MKKLLIATHNPGKLNEFRMFLEGVPFEIISLSDVGITEDVEEDGTTYEENSQKKALFYAQKSGLPALSDDGGLEIVALNNQPGIHSRRWLGYPATDEELIEHMKNISKELPENNRKAFFKTVVSLALPDGQVWSVMGEVEGVIAKKPLLKFSKGYPYRSFFYLPQLKKYYFETELTPKELKIYNHRYKAVQEIKQILKKLG
jgi:XTP/dITP diphosphohydrolase